MGIEINIRVTAYLKFVCPKKTEYGASSIACCGKSQEGKFCQSCGKKIEFRSYSVQVDAVDQSEIRDEIEEALCHLSDCSEALPDDGCDVWYPNDAGVIDEETPGYYEITDRMIAAQKKKIVRLYAEQIAVLAKHYGAQPEVCFGMLVWSA